VELVPEVVELVPEVVELVPEVVELVPEVVELVPEVVELVPEVVELVPEVVELVPEVVELVPCESLCCGAWRLLPKMLGRSAADQRIVARDVHRIGAKPRDRPTETHTNQYS
jgi:hypothetical protein